MRIKIILAVLIILCTLLPSTHALAATTSTSAQYWWTVWYTQSGVMLPWPIEWNANLGNYYWYDFGTASFIYDDHYLCGGVYIGADSGNGNYPFSQGVNGLIDYFDNGVKKPTLYLTSSVSQIYRQYWRPWGGSNSTAVYLTGGSGNDYVRGTSTWWGHGTNGPTNPPTVTKYLYYTYRN